MRYYILTKKGCEKCERLKERIGAPENVMFLDAENLGTKEMALLSFYEVLKAPLPTLVDTETSETIEGNWIGIARKLGVM